MPVSGGPIRDPRTERDLFAVWVASEDHFGDQGSSSAKSELAVCEPSLPEPQLRTLDPSPQGLVLVQGTTSSTALSDANTQAPEQQPSSSPTPSSEPVSPQRVEDVGPSGSASSGLVAEPPALTQGPAPRQPPHLPRRTRSQVSRDSFNLLWREYLALTASTTDSQQNPNRRPQHQQREQPTLAHLPSDVNAGASTSRPSSLTQRPGTSAQLPASSSSSISRGPSRRVTAPASNTTTATRITMAAPSPPATILQGPQPYDKPKGLAAVLIPLLCPPTDIFDLQRLTKLFIALFVRLSSLVVALSFVLVPGLLWLIRHEFLLGHKGDAILVAVAGLVLFVVADAVKRAAARAAAARRSGTFAANTKGAYQLAPGSYTAAPVPAAAAGARSVPSPRAANGSVTAGAATAANGAAAADPVVRRVKQRIIKLEHVLFGNELTEGDIGRDALLSRVQLLCSEVGVPFGGPGGSSARPTVAELDAQLLAVETALGV